MTRDEYLAAPVLYAKRGTDLPHARLTEAAVRDIRRRYKPCWTTAADLARQHGVSKRCIEKVVAYESWRHVL